MQEPQEREGAIWPLLDSAPLFVKVGGWGQKRMVEEKGTMISSKTYEVPLLALSPLLMQINSADLKNQGARRKECFN